MYLLTKHRQVFGIFSLLSEVVSHLREVEQELQREYVANGNSAYYVCAENYAAQNMQYMKVLFVPNMESLKKLDWVSYYGMDTSYLRGTLPVTPDDVIDVTEQIMSITTQRFEGVTKVFATVVKSGLKSSGMEVVLDPGLNSFHNRSVEYYEGLVGTFARIKATTNIHDYGCATLFFSPEALGNIRLETQMIDGYIINWN